MLSISRYGPVTTVSTYALALGHRPVAPRELSFSYRIRVNGTALTDRLRVNAPLASSLETHISVSSSYRLRVNEVLVCGFFFSLFLIRKSRDRVESRRRRGKRKERKAFQNSNHKKENTV